MKKIELEGKIVEIKTGLNELNIQDFETLMVKIKSETYTSELDKNIDILSSITNLSVDEIESLEIENFKELALNLNIADFETINERITNIIEVDGVTYKSRSNALTYNFTVKEMKLVTVAFTNNPDSFISDLLAIVFMPVDGEGNIVKDYSPDGLEARAAKFRNINIEIANPYLVAMSQANAK